MRLSEKWLREYITLPASMEQIAERLTLAGLEIKNLSRDPSLDDVISEIEITSNRPDWLSYLGIVRELAGLYGRPVRFPKRMHLRKQKKGIPIKIHASAREACPFYSAVLIEEVSVIDSPEWIQRKIMAMGLRPVNLIVDLTNIVLFELGQPMHAFDYETISSGQIEVRFAKEGEPFSAINHSEYCLTTRDLIICDRKGPLALAGVMGGERAEVSRKTKNVLLESAFFHPSVIRATSRRHQLSSDSSYRFERRVDRGAVVKAHERFVQLLKTTGAFKEVSKVTVVGSDRVPKRRICLDQEFLKDYLGFSIPERRVEQILNALGLDVKSDLKRRGIVNVLVPSFRPDLVREVDLIEEIVRVHGYDRVPETLPKPFVQKDFGLERARTIEALCKSVLTAVGLQEVLPFTLINEKIVAGLTEEESQWVRIINPQNKELRLMRPSLIPSLLEVAQSNVNDSIQPLRYFEIGSTYHDRKKKLPDEVRHIGILVSGRTARKWYSPGRNLDFYDLKGVLEDLFLQLRISVTFAPAQETFLDPSYSFGVFFAQKKIGSLGRPHPLLLRRFDFASDVSVAEVDFHSILLHTELERQFKEFSKYPVIKRDIAVRVDGNVLAGDLEQAILEASEGLIRRIETFDSFSGKGVPDGKKNVAFLMEFSSSDRTLSNEEVEIVFQKLFSLLHQKFGAVYKEA